MAPYGSEGARLDTGRPLTATNAAAAKLQVRAQRTRLWHVVPDAHTVVARSGSTRLVLRVPRCPWCGCPHQHHGQVGLETARRRAACGMGSYILEVAAPARWAAA